MAVRVEEDRRRRFPWWLLALLALTLIALVIGLLLALDVFGADEEGEVSNVQTIVAAEDPGELVGRPVNLENVQVQGVLGDTAYWIGPSEDERVLLVFPEEQAETEARVNLSEGDTVTLDGTIEQMPENPEEQFRLGGGGDEAQLADDEVYVSAESLEETR